MGKSRQQQDAEFAKRIAESAWERMRLEADLSEEVERAFERIVAQELTEDPASQVRLRTHVTEPEERAARAKRGR